MSTTRIFHFAESTLYGPIAQLGERTVRIRKVVGSIPIRSTKMCRQKRYTEETPHRSAVFLLFEKVLEEISTKKFNFRSQSKLFQRRALGVMQNPVFREVSVSNSSAFSYV